MSEMMIKIDWLTLTKKMHYTDVDKKVDKNYLMQILMIEGMRIGVDVSEFEVTHGDGFYDLHVLFSNSGVRASAAFELEKQGIKFVFSGKALTSPTMGQRVLLSAYENDFKPTRIDVAIDVFNRGVTVKEVYVAYDAAHGENKQRSVEFKQRKWGDSLYIGSRNSEKMLRVYDKAGEQGLANDWVRFEMEFKGSAAVQVTPKCLTSLYAIGMVHVSMLSLPSFPIAIEIEEFAQGIPFEFTRKLPSKDGRDKWLYNVVGKTLAKMKAKQPEQFAELMTWVEEMSNGYDVELF